MYTPDKPRFSVVQFPEEIKGEGFLDRSILQLGPIRNSSLLIYEYTRKKLMELDKKQSIPYHVPLDQFVTSFNPLHNPKSNEREYNIWMFKKIEYHLVPDVGRVVLLIIPRISGKVESPVRGYAKHTGFELGWIAKSHQQNGSNIVVCIEKGAPEEEYYRDNLELLCKGLNVHHSVDEAIIDAYMKVTTHKSSADSEYGRNAFAQSAG